MFLAVSHYVYPQIVCCVIQMYFSLYRLILIAEKTTVYERFPTPLINRLEKHFVLTSSVLKDWQQLILKVLNEWISNFSEVIHSRLLQYPF